MTRARDTSKGLLWILVGIVALAALVSVLAVSAGWTAWGAGMMGLMGVWMLVPVLFFVWLLSVLIDHGRPHAPAGAFEVAERRYAAGEITRHEYERIRDDLRRPHA